MSAAESIFDGADLSDEALLAEAKRQKQEEAHAPVEVDPAEVSKELPIPDFIKRMHEDYRSSIAHCFLVHGNVNDYPDNSGNRGDLRMLFSQVFDSFWLEKRLREQNPQSSKTASQQSSSPVSRPRVFCYFTVNSGLVFVDDDSRSLWEKLMRESYASRMDQEELEEVLHPSDFPSALRTFDLWFEASRERYRVNRNQTVRGKKVYPGRMKQEILLTFAIFDADLFLPNASISELGAERLSIGYIRNWARDKELGNRNRIIFVARHLEDIQESLRAGDSGISTILVKHPSLEERLEWLVNYESAIQKNPPRINGRLMKQVSFAPEFSLKAFAITAAGMPRRHLENTIMLSWIHGCPLDYQLVREQKQKAIQDEFGGLIEFFEPEFGFEQVGGHEHLKKYFNRKIIVPLRMGDRRTCSKGVILAGPPGTGKTKIALALAKECKINFIVAHLDRVFGGIVGETERHMRQLLEAIDAASPCIVFMDEIDSVLSSGRSSPGDSGTAARVFNSLMTFLSDDSRAGRVVVVAASNRPDLLDTALLRAGRFDAILPALPPGAGDAAGRLKILKALLTKFKVKFAKDLQPTAKQKDAGVGRLLHDERIWTGAEIEAVLKEAIDNAVFDLLEKNKESKEFSLDRAKVVIGSDHWERAMNDILPNTGEVEAQIDLALYFTNHLGYCPEEWRDRARNKEQLRSRVTRVDAGDYNFDRE